LNQLGSAEKVDSKNTANVVVVVSLKSRKVKITLELNYIYDFKSVGA